MGMGEDKAAFFARLDEVAAAAAEDDDIPAGDPVSALKGVGAPTPHPSPAEPPTAFPRAPYATLNLPYGPTPPDPPQALWRIWSNVHRKWYLPDAVGYTPDIDKAGLFMPDAALSIYAHSAYGWLPTHPFLIAIVLVPA
jgi:hypothetical protein